MIQNKSIELHKKNINYILKTSTRAKRLRLVIYNNGNLVVIRPIGLSEKAVEKYIIKKADWVVAHMHNFQHYKGIELRGDHAHYIKHKNLALSFTNKKIHHFNTIYNYQFQNVTIRNQKTRWGSCSKKGNLNFNYKILFLPQHISDYLVVHELCHLQEFNHSHNFWNLVAMAIPNHKAIRKELKHGSIHLF